jgi:hypothetical protein
MEQSTVSPSSIRQSAVFADSTVKNESNSSGVSWAAVIGGAFVTAALSLILLALGTGVGLSSVSPWSNVGASASAIGAAAIAWFIVMQILASSFGGYLAGRLRTKWAGIHSDEVYFRDTAHGFLAWAVALIITAAFLATAAAAMVGGAPSSASASGSAASSAANSSRALDPNQYFVDTLFRSDRKIADPSVGNLPVGNSPATGSAVVNPNSTDSRTQREAALIFANGIRQGTMPPSDQAYLAQLVSEQTGLTQPDAAKRVSDVFGAAQQATDAARKALAHASIWIFLALLIGAFCASLAATFGGRQRDHVVVV